MIKKLRISVPEISWVRLWSMSVTFACFKVTLFSSLNDPVAYSISCYLPYNLRNGTSSVAAENTRILLDEHTVVLYLPVH